MLKIKDNVNLEELKKYGFKENWYYGTSYIRVKDDYPLYVVIITAKHRYIQIRDGNFGNIAGSLQDLLYDLIQAGLVEKVEG